MYKQVDDHSPESQQVIKIVLKLKDFSDSQGQLTPQSMVSGRNSNSSETL